MSPERSEELIALYPDLFSGLDSMKPFWMFRFECGDGWFELLKDLIAEIRSICERDGNSSTLGLDDESVPIKVSQIKEKYGTLRFYTNWSTKPINDAIDEAAHKSATTCEVCGKAGRLVKSGGWWHVACESCS